MTELRVQCFSVSLDGFGAGPDQSLENPLGVGGARAARVGLPDRHISENGPRQRHRRHRRGQTISRPAVSRGLARGFSGATCSVPVRGPWLDEEWKGWWGDNPPYHTQVFVLTHHPRPPLEMEGGTTFHFVTDGTHAALDRANAAAGGLDVRLGGGVATIQQYVRAGLVDELHLAFAPVLLGSGEKLFTGIDMRALGYQCVERAATEKATHIVLRKA